jgi:hypothetical protein
MTNGLLRGLFQRSFSTLPAAPSAPGGVAAPPRQQMQAALAAAIAKARTNQAAQRREMTPDQLAAFEAYWQRRTERSMRAKEAQKARHTAARARDFNPAPVTTKLWSKAMSLQAATDTRLTMGARVALQAIRSLTGRLKRVSRSGLAVLLGVHPRTAQRYLSELRERGYIRTRLLVNKMGWVIAQLVEVTEKALPKHHRPRTAPTLADGLARCLSTPENGGRPGETEPSPCESKYLTLTGRGADPDLLPLLRGAA